MTERPSKTLGRFHLNGDTVECAFEPNKTLLEVLREDLALTGTKHGCELGHCGACTVLLDGQPALACLTLALSCGDREILTIEGLAAGADLHPLQRAFMDAGATQCGYCTPGFILGGAALLEENPLPTREQIKGALAGHLCRCTGYAKIVDAVMLASERMQDDR